MENILPGLWGAPHIHPALVHFPIALWSAVVLFWGAALALKNDDAWKFGRWLLYLGTISGLAALGAGFLAADQLGHDSPGHDFVHNHRDFMIATTVLASIVTIAAAALRKREGLGVKLGLMAGMVITAGVLTLGADRGAALVYLYGVGMSDAPPPESGGHDHGGHDHGGDSEGKEHHGSKGGHKQGDSEGGDHHGAQKGHQHGDEADEAPKAEAVEPSKDPAEPPEAGGEELKEGAAEVKDKAEDKAEDKAKTPTPKKKKGHEGHKHKH